MRWVYIVLCMDEPRGIRHTGIAGALQPDTRVWETEAEALAFAKQLAPSRRPLVAMVRHPDEWRTKHPDEWKNPA